MKVKKADQARFMRLIRNYENISKLKKSIRKIRKTLKIGHYCDYCERISKDLIIFKEQKKDKIKNKTLQGASFLVYSK